MEGGWCCSWKDVLSWTSPHQGTRVTWLQDNLTLNGRGMVWCLEGCSALNLSLSGNHSYLATRRNLTLNGRGIVWFLEGCSALNLSSSGNSCTRLRSCKLFPPPVVQIWNKIIDINGWRLQMSSLPFRPIVCWW
jgi:hypothetical protein